MEVDSKSEAIENSEALLLGDDGEEHNTEFTSGDVELLLGDDDVDAFANESYEAPSEDASTEEKTDSSSSSTIEKQEAGQPIEGHYNRGRGGRPYMRGGRGYGPPTFFPRGLRPPFPGALPRFGRHPPPFAFRGRPPMGYMRYPRGMFMRPPRHHHYTEEEEEEDESMPATEETGEDGGDAGGTKISFFESHPKTNDSFSGPKSLMSIRVSKDVKQAVKTTILSKGPLLHAPLGMGMGPRFHLRGMPPRGPPPPGAPAPPAAAPAILPSPVPANVPHHHSSSSILGRGSSRGSRGGMDHHHSRGSLKRPLPSHHSSDQGPRAKMMMQTSSYPINPSSGVGSGSRSNLRTIQTVDEQRQQRFQHPPPASPMQTNSSSSSHHYHSNFTVSHKPAPTLTQIQTVPESAPAAAKNNLRSIPTIGGSSVPTPMQGPRIAKTGGASHRVMISNLPPMMSFERISAMTTACGNVRTINVNENGTAIVEFVNPSGAENFIRANNRKMIDRSMISVARLA